jgi:hypothetical protein
MMYVVLHFHQLISELNLEISLNFPSLWIVYKCDTNQDKCFILQDF